MPNDLDDGGYDCVDLITESKDGDDAECRELCDCCTDIDGDCCCMFDHVDTGEAERLPAALYDDGDSTICGHSDVAAEPSVS